MAENNDKGALLEDVVTRLHQMNGFRATPRVKLPPLQGRGEPREIDVLLTSGVGPYSVEIPIECKNWGEVVGLDEIGAFRDKLDDVGLNVRGAIYVSVAGFSAGALRRASVLGIETLVASGLTEDRLRIASHVAFSHTLFLIPYVPKFQYTSFLPTAQPVFHTPEGEYGGHVLDLVWKAWMLDFPTTLAPSTLSEPVPQGWGAWIDGTYSEITGLTVDIKVEGHLLTFAGTSQRTGLSRAKGGEFVLGNVDASFEPEEGRYELLRFEDEASLSAHIGSMKAEVATLFRTKVPRIRGGGPHGPFVWLPTDAFLHELDRRLQEDPERYLEGAGYGPAPFPSTIQELFELPSKKYVQILRAGIGRGWPESLWHAVSAPETWGPRSTIEGSMDSGATWSLNRAANERTLDDGGRIFSAYTLATTKARIWVITEADRSATTLLLPEEY